MEVAWLGEIVAPASVDDIGLEHGMAQRMLGDIQRANLGTIVREAAGLFSTKGARFNVRGPEVWLTPTAALSVTMALHELCTNAAKYGAPSTDEGRIEVEWRLEGEGAERRLHFRWAEKEGSPVQAPKRRGFGTRLVERALAADLGGDVRVDYQASGVICAIEAPLPRGQERLGPIDDRPES